MAIGVIGNNKKNIVWANVAKFLAMIAVVIDHSYNVFYSNKKIQIFSFFSVSVFVIIQGFVTYISYIGNKNICKKTIYRIKNIIFHYFIASILVYILTKKIIDLELIKKIINFKVEGAYYYVFLYIQLAICSIIIIKIDEKLQKIISKILLCLIIITLSVFSSMHQVFKIYGGGGVLFGGSFLFLLYFGIMLGKHYYELQSFITNNKIIKPVLMILLLIWIFFINFNSFRIDELLFGRIIYNPPNLTLCIYSILIVLNVMTIVNYVIKLNYNLSNLIIFVFNYIGKHTLFIFLYHSLLIRLLSKCLKCDANYIVKIPCVIISTVIIILVCLSCEPVYNALINKTLSVIKEFKNKYKTDES